MDASLIGASPSPLPLSVQICAITFVIAEFIFDFLCIFVSILTFIIIRKTSILHRNLKFILQCQCSLFLLNALIKVFLTIPIKFISGDIFWIEKMFRPTLIVIFAIVYARISLPVVIVLERTLATIYAKNYDRQKWDMFNYVWPTLTFLFIVANLVIQQGQIDATNLSVVNVVNSHAVFLLTCLEILIFSLLWRYNDKKYKQNGQIPVASSCPANVGGGGRKSYDLTERYQYLENVRISLQLAPTMSLYLLNSMNNSFLSIFIKYFVTDNDDDHSDEIVVTISILLTSLFNLLMEITIICLHPILKRNFVAIFDGFLRRSRVHPSPRFVANSSDNATISAKHHDMEEHFRVLAKYWQ